MMSNAVENYIKAHSKGQFLGFILTLLFGPLGLFYSNWVAALILCAIAVMTAVTIVGPALCWSLSIVISFFAVSKHNKKVRATANLSLAGK